MIQSCKHFISCDFSDTCPECENMYGQEVKCNHYTPVDNPKLQKLIDESVTFR